ncbi:MAG: hypothetical protein ACK5EA_29805 [Planctomycetaceae bacterium]
MRDTWCGDNRSPLSPLPSTATNLLPPDCYRPAAALPIQSPDGSRE